MEGHCRQLFSQSLTRKRHRASKLTRLITAEAGSAPVFCAQRAQSRQLRPEQTRFVTAEACAAPGCTLVYCAPERARGEIVAALGQHLASRSLPVSAPTLKQISYSCHHCIYPCAHAHQFSASGDAAAAIPAPKPNRFRPKQPPAPPCQPDAHIHVQSRTVTLPPVACLQPCATLPACQPASHIHT